MSLTPEPLTLDALVATLVPAGDGELAMAVAENWTQGRTLYGGATAALALAATRTLLPGLPALRSMQVAFVGPISDHVRFVPRLLRQGRSASFVSVEARSGGSVAAMATLVFAASRESTVDLPAAAGPKPALGDTFHVPAQVRFASNFDFWFASEKRDPCDRLVRLKEPSELDAEIELLAVADLLPPPALFDFAGFVPLSSMSWQLDLMRPAARSHDRRWRLVATKEMNSGGLSTQGMSVDDGDGVPLARGRQLVALFS